MTSAFSENIIQQLTTEYEAFGIAASDRACAAICATASHPPSRIGPIAISATPNWLSPIMAKNAKPSQTLHLASLKRSAPTARRSPNQTCLRTIYANSSTCLIEQYEVDISVGRSAQEIPFPYVLDGSADLELGVVSPNELARHFPTTELADIGDEDCRRIAQGKRPRQFSAGAVRRPAHRFLAGTASPLYGRARRACAALYPFHQLSPLC